MQNETTPAEGFNSAQLEAESALRGAACSLLLIPDPKTVLLDILLRIGVPFDTAKLISLGHSSPIALASHLIKNHPALCSTMESPNGRKTGSHGWSWALDHLRGLLAGRM